MPSELTEPLSLRDQPSLRRRAAVTFVRRSSTGGVVYALVTSAILLAASWQPADQRWGWVIVLAMVGVAGLRFVTGRRILARPDDDEPFLHRLYRAGVVLGGVLWATFSAGTIAAYGLDGPTHLVTPTVAGVTAGIAISGSIDARMFRTMILVTLAPPIIALFSLGSREGLGLGAMFAFFGGLNFTVGRQLNRDYWSAEERRFLLEERARELDGALAGAEEAGRAKSQFLASISHELRTPLHGVMGMADLLSHTPLSTVQRRYTEIISSSSEHLLALINDLLDVSRLDAGGLTLESVAFDLDVLVEDVAELVALQAGDKGLDLLVSVHPGAPRRVLGDPGRVRQVLTNLLTNAVKFTERGRVRVDVEPCPIGVCLAVSDTGVGIPPETRSRIFEPFVQGTTRSGSSSPGGTGLGLAICKGLVGAMNGKLLVQSEVDRGSRFEVRLPLENAGGWRGPDRIPLRVALADPSPERRSVVKERVEDLGCEVQLVAGPSEAPDVDVCLVAADAVDAALREAVRSTGQPPVVLLCRRSEDADRRFAGAVRQPFRRRDLAEALASAAAGLTPDESGEHRILPVDRFDASVLVVEDNAVNRVVARQFLEALGCDVETVDDGAKAVRRVAERRFDLVLMDCRMPVLDGFEATEAIRAAEPSGSRVPIVAMTASVTEDDKERAYAAGMDDWLEKPVRPEQLVDVLRLVSSREPPPSEGGSRAAS